MLAADYETLPGPMRDAIIRFFDDNEEWVARVVDQGAQEGTLRLTAPPRAAAQAIVSGLEGALLVARPYGDAGRFQAAAGGLLTSLAGAASQAPAAPEPR
jgi:TetR/AcrR family transcriptional repressor of nem operon